MSQLISLSTDFPSRKEAIDSMLKAVADRNTKFLSMFLKLNDSVDNVKWEWVDKTLVGFKDTLKAALTSTTTTTMTVNSNSNVPKRYIDGLSLVYIDDEIVLVTSTITVSTDFSSYNITRAQVGTTAATHANNSQLMLFGNPRTEGFNAGRDDSQRGARRFNYTQIFERQIKLSGSSQSVDAVGNELKLANQMRDATKEIVKELQMALIYGMRAANDSTNYTDRKLGGFRYWATQGGGNNENAGGNSLDNVMIDNVIEAYLNRGGDASSIGMAVSVRQQRKLNDLKIARIVGGGMTQKETALNNYVETYDFGSRAHVDVMYVTDLRDDEVYFFDKNNIEVKPLRDRAWKKKDLPEDGDFVREMVLGEFTTEFRNNFETLYRYYGLGVA